MRLSGGGDELYLGSRVKCPHHILYFGVNCPGNDSEWRIYVHHMLFSFHVHAPSQHVTHTDNVRVCMCAGVLCMCVTLHASVYVCVRKSHKAASVSITLSVHVPVFVHPCTCVYGCSPSVGTASPPLASTRYNMFCFSELLPASSYWAVVEQAMDYFCNVLFEPPKIWMGGPHLTASDC